MSIKGIGIDIVDISRMAEQVKKNYDRLAKSFLTEAELQRFCNSKFPERFLASHFAAKEAAAKALGTGFSQGVSFLSFSIDTDDLGGPILKLSGKAKEISVGKNISTYHLSMSYEERYAIATVVCE